MGEGLADGVVHRARAYHGCLGRSLRLLSHAQEPGNRQGFGGK